MKTPLMLIPGLLCNERVWQHQLRHFPFAKVIMTTKESTPDAMVRTLLEQAPEKFALAGHSMGGWLALEIMRVAPERVTKLCLINTSAKSDTPEKLAKRKQMIEAVVRGEFPKIAEEIADHFVYNSSIIPEVLKMFDEVGPDAFMCQEKAMIARDDCVPILRTIHIPTSIIHAEKDQNFTLKDHQELASKIPGAKLHLIPNSGHMSPMEAPEAVTYFLKKWLE